MQVTLDKRDLMALVMSTEPSYEFMEEEHVSKLGAMTGKMSPQWKWHVLELRKLNEADLWSLYQELRHLEPKFALQMFFGLNPDLSLWDSEKDEIILDDLIR